MDCVAFVPLSSMADHAMHILFLNVADVAVVD